MHTVYHMVQIVPYHRGCIGPVRGRFMSSSVLVCLYTGKPEMSRPFIFESVFVLYMLRGVFIREVLLLL
jgi:hypothetical protein